MRKLHQKGTVMDRLLNYASNYVNITLKGKLTVGMLGRTFVITFKPILVIFVAYKRQQITGNFYCEHLKHYWLIAKIRSVN